MRINGNLNYIFFFQKRWTQIRNDTCSWIVGCRNSAEYNQFIWKFNEFTIDGCTLFVNVARRDLEARYTIFNSSIIPAIKLLKLKASKAYNKFFPSERLMEIIIECDAINILNLVDGIVLDFKHSTRMLNDEMFISIFKQQELPKLQRILTDMGNTDVSFMEGTLFLMDKSIWCRQRSLESNEWINVVDQNLMQKNIITNGLDINNIRNSLL